MAADRVDEIILADPLLDRKIVSQILEFANAHHLEFRYVPDVFGEKSFGKGTIQDAENFKDGSGLHITIEKWLTPEKVWVHKKQDIEGGIQPDITVEMSDEDIKAGLDKQLDKAVELSKQI